MPRALPLLLALLTLLPAAPAMADVLMPDQAACHEKAAGDPCEMPPGGSCQPAECCRRRFGGPPPANGAAEDPKTPLDCRDCLRCAPKAHAHTPDMAPPPPDMPAAPPVAAPPKGGMCASAPWHSDAGAWSLLAGALLLVTLTTRRRA